MKSTKYFAMMLAATALIASCQEKEPETQPDPDPVVEKSHEAKLSAITVSAAGGIVIEGKVYEDYKEVDLVYVADQFEVLKAATATVTISEGATISPDPSQTVDYTAEGGVKYTVTAEDGETSVTYTIGLKLGERSIYVGEAKWQKTYGEMGLAASEYHGCGVPVAFCSKKNFATHDGQVFDLDGIKVGEICKTGMVVSDFRFVSMSNTTDGVLVASVGISSDGQAAPAPDGIASTYYYAWLDGWDKAPTNIITFEGANVARYMSCTGDSKGEAIISFPAQANSNPMFHIYHYTNGIAPDAAEWSSIFTGYIMNDGNWGQWITWAGADPINSNLVICDSRGNNLGYAFYVRHGRDAAPENDIILKGTVIADGYAELAAGMTENYEYGNYSMGHGRAFNIFGMDCLVAVSSGWPHAYVTIQTLDNTLPEDEQYLLRTQPFGDEQPSPTSAYIFDEEDQKGIVIVNIANNQGGASFECVRYDIESDII